MIYLFIKEHQSAKLTGYVNSLTIRPLLNWKQSLWNANMEKKEKRALDLMQNGLY